MDELEYCPNCGAKLDKESDFCSNCGLDLKKYLAENSEERPDKNEKKSEPVKKNNNISKDNQTVNKEPKFAPKKINKKPNNKIIGCIILVIILLAAYFLGNMYYSENRQAQKLQSEVTSKSSSQMKSALVDENGKQLSSNQISSLEQLYLNDKKVLKEIQVQINDSQKDNTFSLKKTGKYFMIYPKYSVAMKSKSLDISTNISNPTFYIDGESVVAKAVNSEYHIDKLTPGIYKLKITNAKKTSETKTKTIKVGINNSVINTNINVKKPAKKSTVVKNDTVAKSDVDNSRNKNEEEDSDDSSTSSDTSLVGKYTGDPDLALYSDGNYDLGDKSGTYDILENNDGHVKIRFNQDGGGSIVESYDYTDGELHSSKYDQSWYKD
ncbi:zinc-ribbon domain-containing protein [Companilactobacillus crustorum]|uniref:zinc-ribbon domain-containing protein n=1 Tax=Companilactobacillus crustorum TaxID=392416 RepID=UPI00237DCBB1|nr:zinc ribbon domain-containing protein [Companilactobacillus crustorum]WDT65643.1 zinc-ribbon domain-containing protein [Companilactobacillus crustorum]